MRVCVLRTGVASVHILTLRVFSLRRLCTRVLSLCGIRCRLRIVVACSFCLRVRHGKGAGGVAHKLHKDHVGAYFYDTVPGDKNVVRGCDAFKKTLFPRNYKSDDTSAVVEHHIADVSELSAVGDVDDCFARHFRKRVLFSIHTKIIFFKSTKYD